MLISVTGEVGGESSRYLGCAYVIPLETSVVFSVEIPHYIACRSEMNTDNSRYVP